MKTRQGYVQGYKVQAVVSQDQAIAVVGVTQEANEVQQVKPMLATLESTLEAVGIEERQRVGLADAGYWSEANVTACCPPEGTEWLIATTKDWKQRKALRDSGCPRGRMPKNLRLRGRMEREAAHPEMAMPVSGARYHGRTGVGIGEGRTGLPPVYETGATSCSERGVSDGDGPQSAEAVARRAGIVGLGQCPLELTGVAQPLWIHLPTEVGKKVGSVISREIRRHGQHQSGTFVR